MKPKHIKPSKKIAKESKGERIPLVVFSGGTDSTIVLYDLLRHTSVDIITFEHGYNLPSAEPERIARDKILELLKNDNQLPYKLRNHYKVTDELAPTTRPTCPQLGQHWLALLLHLRPTQTSCVCLGLLASDSTNVLHDEAVDSWSKAVEFLFEKQVPMYLPLGRCRKAVLVNWLPQAYREVVWSCNTPIVKKRGRKKTYLHCGRCTSCVTTENAKRSVDADEYRDTKCREAAVLTLDEDVGKDV